MYGSLNRSVSRHSLPLLSRILGRDLSPFFFFFDILNVSSAARSVRRTTPSGWTISSACSSSSSSSRGACGKAPRRRPTFLGAFFWTDCRRSDGSLCLRKLRFVFFTRHTWAAVACSLCSCATRPFDQIKIKWINAVLWRVLAIYRWCVFSSDGGGYSSLWLRVLWLWRNGETGRIIPDYENWMFCSSMSETCVAGTNTC